MNHTPRVLLVAPRLKDYWASPYGQGRVAAVITAKTIGFPLLDRRRLALYPALALRARVAAKAFDVVMCVERHLALAYGGIRQMTGPRTPAVAHQFILPDAGDKRRRQFAAAWDRWASGGLNCVLVNSSHEARTYADRLAPGCAVRFMPLAVPPAVSELQSSLDPGPSVFSGGGAMRDYPTLIRAVENLSCNVHIVTFGQENLEGAARPANTLVVYYLPFTDFLRAMAQAWVVVIPLHRTERAAGQATLVYAQALGKAVIASDVPGVRDYIAHGVTGWLVPPEDAEALRHAIQSLLADEALRTRLEAGARAQAAGNYSYAEYDRRMGRILEDAAAAKR